MNLRVWLEQKAELNADRAFIYWKKETITYSQLDTQVNKAANMLSGLGIKKGDKCAIWLPNCPEYLYLWFGLAKLGAIAACVDTNLRGSGLQYLIDSGDCSAVIIDSSLAGHYRSIRGELRKVKHVLWYPKRPQAEEDGHSLDSLIKSAAVNPPPILDIKGGDPVSFIHTGGTTGLPKWCVISNNYYIAIGQYFADFLAMMREDIVFDPLPLFHMNPQGYYIMGSLTANAAILLTERFSASAFWSQVQDFKVTVIILHVGPVDILKKRPAEEFREHRVRVCFSADAEFMKKFNIPMAISGYGSTEAGGLVCFRRHRLPFTPEDTSLPSLRSVCGKPRDDIELIVANTEGEQIPPGQIGEILVRPLQPGVIFDGYYNSPEKTREVYKDLWFHTGDMGYFDDKGILHVAHRDTESIRVRGQWVDISLLEKLILSHPQISECAVVGVPGEIGGEEIKASIQLKTGSGIRPEEIIRYCEDKIAHYMIPRFIEFIDEIPRSSLGKVEKVKLKGRGVRNAWDREAAGYKIKRN